MSRRISHNEALYIRAKLGFDDTCHSWYNNEGILFENQEGFSDNHSNQRISAPTVEEIETYIHKNGIGGNFEISMIYESLGESDKIIVISRWCDGVVTVSTRHEEKLMLKWLKKKEFSIVDAHDWMKKQNWYRENQRAKEISEIACLYLMDIVQGTEPKKQSARKTLADKIEDLISFKNGQGEVSIPIEELMFLVDNHQHEEFRSNIPDFLPKESIAHKIIEDDFKREYGTNFDSSSLQSAKEGAVILLNWLLKDN